MAGRVDDVVRGGSLDGRSQPDRIVKIRPDKA